MPQSSQSSIWFTLKRDFARRVCHYFGHRRVKFNYSHFQRDEEWQHYKITACARCGRAVGNRAEPHTFSDWQYQADRSCQTVRRCSGCGYEIIADQHDFGWRLQGCTRREVCQRCGLVRQETSEHAYEWEPGVSCTQRETCRRCGEVRRMVTEHDYEWVLLDACTRQQVCSRCGAPGETAAEHAYRKVGGEFACQHELVCLRCENTQRVTRHEYQTNSTHVEDNAIPQIHHNDLVCIHCGEKNSAVELVFTDW